MSRNKPIHFWLTDSELRPFNSGKEQSSQQMVLGTTQYAHAKEWILDNYPHAILKINSKWIKEINVGAKPIKLLEETMGVNAHDLGLGNGVLDMKPKVQATTKTKIW